MTYFSDYLEYCRRLIITRRVDYANANDELKKTILHANLPFEYLSSSATRQAVILIHGLYDSPCSMQSLSTIFLNENYLVRSVLLPGHGTCPEDLQTTTYQAWLTACRLAIQLLPASIERIVIAGFSTGALLSHYLALQQDIPRLIALVSLAPALQLHSLERTLLNNKHFMNFASRFSPWSYQGSVYDYAKYTKHALNGAHQVQRLIAQCPNTAFNLPVLWVLSANDKIIDSKSIWQDFQKNHHHPQSRCLIYSPTPLTSLSDTRFIIRTSCYPEQSIINFSHICLTIAPNHPHYGRTGDYTLSINAAAKKPLVFGERGGKTTARLTYNPDFDYMAQAIRDFLKSL